MSDVTSTPAMKPPRLAAQTAGHKAFQEVPCGLKDAVTAAINAALDAIVPDPEDDVQCTIVAQAICKIRFTPNGDGCECASGGPYIQSCGCEKIAHAVLTALRAEFEARAV